MANLCLNTKMNKAVFLDRDGIINIERKDYVKTIKEFILIDRILDVIKIINSKGYLVIIITNQSAINRKIITENNLREIHNHFLKLAKNKNAKVDGIYFCPHMPSENCECRKPKPGMILKAAKEFQIDLKKSIMFGDSNTDVKAANHAGCTGILVNKSDSIKNIIEKYLK
ncbi:MAG: D-glycero-beta-D-manno-heptose-1,7-bisphosphate 7-phosphatase [Thaumarchaeota archaeon]|nr:MAG: D-glycero-beta-D-manno-heptose-1,7-bisphosphate 7-phosphatase [Nitrososphaerota archaeon]